MPVFYPLLIFTDFHRMIYDGNIRNKTMPKRKNGKHVRFADQKANRRKLKTSKR